MLLTSEAHSSTEMLWFWLKSGSGKGSRSPAPQAVGKEDGLEGETQSGLLGCRALVRCSRNPRTISSSIVWSRATCLLVSVMYNCCGLVKLLVPVEAVQGSA